jgi:hypothetical protein
MSGDDSFDDLRRGWQPMGDVFGSWPLDRFSLPNWLRLQAHKLSVVTIQDEYYFVDLPREWTTDERKYALIIRDPLTRRYDRKLLQWLKDQSNETLAGEVGNLHQELEIKWRFRIYMPRACVLGAITVETSPPTGVGTTEAEERQGKRGPANKEHISSGYGKFFSSVISVGPCPSRIVGRWSRFFSLQ